MSDSMVFAGFPNGTSSFLEAVAANNNREWFETHRADYNQFYVEPAIAFVTALGPRPAGVGYLGMDHLEATLAGTNGAPFPARG